MAWTPKAPADLPRVIAGPILRKVTTDSVSVFIVTSTIDDMVLRIYGKTSGTELLSSVPITPYKIGDNVFIGMLTAKISAPILSAGNVYGYNVFWGADHFGSVGILNSTGDTSVITLDPSTSAFTVGGTIMNLPTFVLPPADLNDLWILHGSCRKAHGEGYDAMGGMLQLLEKAVADAAPTSQFHKRPQVLCLTGDQIYADDVSDAFLYMINKTISKIMGPNVEGFSAPPAFTADLKNALQLKANSKHDRINLPYVYGPYDLENIYRPGYRGHLMRKLGFSVEEEVAKSHLIRLAEYEMMYMFYWSDVLWGSGMPTFDQVNTLLIGGIERQVHSSSTISVEKFGGGLKFKDIDDKGAKAFKEETKRLEKFKAGIPGVRKLLANIQTFMLLDDHEITDDLFFNKKWFDDTKDQGSYIVRNGLAAYAIFQAWGNDPDQFLSTGTPQQTVGKDFMESIQNIATGTNVTNAWIDVENKIYPALSTESIASIPSIGTYPVTSVVGVTQPNNPSIPIHKVLFDFIYTLSYLNFELIGLDTRRARASRKGDNRLPGLISYTDLSRQIKDRGNDRKDITILLSATPILESELFDFFKELFYKKYENQSYSVLNEIDSEPWRGDELFKYSLLSELLTRSKGSTTTGKHRVISLAGDVHFSYSKSFNLKEVNNFLEPSLLSNSQLILASLCASSFKNQTNTVTGTRNMHRLGPSRKDIDNKIIFNNYNNVPSIVHLTDYPYPGLNLDLYKGTEIPYTYTRFPYDYNIPNTNTSPINSIPPIDSYGVSNIFKNISSDKVPLLGIVSVSSSNILSNRVELLTEHKSYALDKALKGGKWHVGKNNFGEVKLNWAPNNYYVKHSLFWREDKWRDFALPVVIPPLNMIRCNTVHIVPLSYIF